MLLLEVIVAEGFNILALFKLWVMPDYALSLRKSSKGPSNRVWLGEFLKRDSSRIVISHY